MFRGQGNTRTKAAPSSVTSAARGGGGAQSSAASSVGCAPGGRLPPACTPFSGVPEPQHHPARGRALRALLRPRVGAAAAGSLGLARGQAGALPSLPRLGSSGASVSFASEGKRAGQALGSFCNLPTTNPTLRRAGATYGEKKREGAAVVLSPGTEHVDSLLQQVIQPEISVCSLQKCLLRDLSGSGNPAKASSVGALCLQTAPPRSPP